MYNVQALHMSCDSNSRVMAKIKTRGNYTVMIGKITGE